MADASGMGKFCADCLVYFIGLKTMAESQKINHASSTIRKPQLLQRAKREGKKDVYSGKRIWMRYSMGARVKVSTDPTDTSAAWDVSLLNISGGGIGFWSNHRIPPGDTIYILDSNDEEPIWLTTEVVHCTVGMRGHLIGAVFLEPIDQRENVNENSEDTNADHEKPETTLAGTLARSSLQAKCAWSAAIASIASLFIAFTLSKALASDMTLAHWAITAAGCSLIAAVASGWLVMRRDAIFIDALHEDIRKLAMGKLSSVQLPAPPSRELSAVRRGFKDLFSQWTKRELDERLRRQKLEDIHQIKSNILAIVSHDLRTPLTSIIMYAHMLKDDIQSLSTEDTQNFVTIIFDECNRLSRLLDDLLEVQILESDHATLNVEKQSLVPILDSCMRVFEPLAKSKSMSLTFEHTDDLPDLFIDADKISQIISNLVSNALKYTPAGGGIVVSTICRGASIIICVADDGQGIPRDSWDQIFDRFSQINDPNIGEVAGVGLGLNIVQKLIERHDGLVWVDSQVGQGSSFYIALPVTQDPPELPQKSDAQPHGRVIACDPDPELAASLAKILRKANYDVRLAHSARRLLQHIEQGDVDVVITDTLLPDMDAESLLEELSRVGGRDYRIIVHSHEADAIQCRQHGMDIFLRRPVTQEELLRAVTVAMQQQSAAGQMTIVVDDDTIHSEQIGRALRCAGHPTMIAENIHEAGSMVANYGGHIVIIHCHMLGQQWSEIPKLRDIGNQTIRIIALCPTIGKTEKRLQNMHNIELFTYSPGREDDLLDAMIASQPHAITETVS